jgi:glucan-binding YG repeat protein
VKSLSASGGWQGTGVSGCVIATICAVEIKSGVKANPKSGLTKIEVEVAGQREWSETQNESSWLSCLSESCDWALVVATFSMWADLESESPRHSVEQTVTAANQISNIPAATKRRNEFNLADELFIKNPNRV